MSMNVGGSGGGPKSDINVTPLVDVMLVLLIIMMIIAPLLQQGVALTLPVATNSAEKPETPEDTLVQITAEGRSTSTARRYLKMICVAPSRRPSRARTSGSCSSRLMRIRRTAP